MPTSQYFRYPAQNGGTVISVGLSLPGSVFSVSGSPVSGTGTLTGSFINQSANTVFAGPASGPSAAPTFRALVSADIPSLSYVTSVSGSAPVVSSGGFTPTISMHVADATHDGYLSSTDWSTFNSKQNALTLGDLTDVGTDGITITGGTGAVVGSGTSISQHVADSTHNGYLSSTDWSTFNNKQPAGNYITALTGDVTASGPGSAAATLATVNANTGSWGTASAVGTFTVNGKGLITAASNTTIAITGSQVSGDIAGNAANVTGTVAANHGGTGQTSLTLNNVILGNGTSPVQFVAPGSGGNILTSDGTTWSSQPPASTATITAWTSFSMTITGTSSNPTKGTTTIDNAQWRRVGQNMEIIYTLAQTVAGTAGSGDYLFLVPNSQSIDTSIMPADSSGVIGVCGGSNVSTASTANSRSNVNVFVYDSTHLALSTQNGADSAIQRIGSALYALSNANTTYSFFASVPISGWTP